LSDGDSPGLTLVAGWFSYPEMGASAGDLFARDLVCGWLEAAGQPHHVAVAPPFSDGIDVNGVQPGLYERLVFVCGPFGNGWPITDLLERFQHCQMVGVNLSMLEPVEAWNPFDVLIERDSSRTCRPDITLLGETVGTPVVGSILVHHQKEYGKLSVHRRADELIAQALDALDVAVVPIDTRLDLNSTGLRTANQVESVIAKMDAVITTRLHGTVLALKNNVPVVPVDPVAGGAKVAEQVRALRWPVGLLAENATLDDVVTALRWCLTGSARSLARRSAAAGRAEAEKVREQFIEAVTSST
jgi:hypothetical protein